jgi:hypothetical protein
MSSRHLKGKRKNAGGQSQNKKTATGWGKAFNNQFYLSPLPCHPNNKNKK